MTKLSDRLEALAEKAPNMCEACSGIGGFEAGGPICCNGSEWECGASGCTGPIDGRYLEQCSACLGTGQQPPHHPASPEG